MRLGIMVSKENEGKVDILLKNYITKLEKKTVEDANANQNTMYVFKEDSPLNANDFFNIIVLTKGYHTSKTSIKQNDLSWFQGFFENSLHSSIELNREEIITAINLIGNYNCFEPKKAIEWLLNYIYSIKIFYNDNNLNNGQSFFNVFIGREGSPVIYGKKNIFFLDNKNITTKIISTYLKTAGKMVDVDEFNVKKNKGYIEFRAWWD